MLRRAVINHLQNNIPELGGRIYQAFFAPAGCGRPYATVKLAAQRGSSKIGFAGSQVVQVYIYDDPGTFIDIDNLENSVIEAICRGDITDGDTGNQFDLEWLPGAGDFVDQDKCLIGRMISFEAALIRV